MQRRVVDLSHPINAEVSMFPGHPAPLIEEYLSREAAAANYAEGTSFVIHRYSFLGNTGAYLDSPFHRHASGDDLATLNLASTVDLPGIVVDARQQVNDGSISVGREALEGLDVRGKAVLIATGWSQHWSTPAYLGAKPYLDADGAQVLTDGGAELVGLDTWNIDDTTNRARPAHTVLLAAGIPIVENLRGVEELIGATFRFFAAPLPFVGGSAISVRAFALVE